jgi:hypothetical protein
MLWRGWFGHVYCVWTCVFSNFAVRQIRINYNCCNYIPNHTGSSKRQRRQREMVKKTCYIMSMGARIKMRPRPLAIGSPLRESEDVNHKKWVFEALSIAYAMRPSVWWDLQTQCEAWIQPRSRREQNRNWPKGFRQNISDSINCMNRRFNTVPFNKHKLFRNHCSDIFPPVIWVVPNLVCGPLPAHGMSDFYVRYFSDSFYRLFVSTVK